MAAGLFAYRITRRYTAALLAVGFTAVLPIMLQDSLARPWRSATDGHPVLAHHRNPGMQPTVQRDGLGRDCGAGGQGYALPGAGRGLRGGGGVGRLREQDYARAVLTVSFAGVLMSDAVRPVPDGPHQYESAARVAEQIAQTFPRGEWFLVSPTHELTSVLGRGWHVELLNFLKEYSEASVEPPDFKFPWQADIFIFVEKEPLTRPNANGGSTHGGHGMALVGDRVTLAYGTPLGRASTEIRLARIVAAYGRTHDNVSMYYEDAKLIVYRISRGPASITASN